MPASQLQNIGLYAGFTPGEAGWDDEMDYNLKAMDTLGQIRVVDKDLSAPPGSPTTGQVYIVGASPTGAWAGQANALARWSGSAWVFYTPRSGWLAYVIDETEFYHYTGSAWTRHISRPVDIQASVSGDVPADAVLVGLMPFATATTFPADFAGSQAVAGTAPTLDAVFEVYKNASVVGTITFVEATTSAVFATSGGLPVSFAPGDTIRIIGPASADATLADIGIALAGTR